MTLEDYVEAAIVSECAKRSKDVPQTYGGREDIVRQLSRLLVGDISLSVISDVMDRLVRAGVADVIRDEVAGDFYRLDHAKIVPIYSQEIRNPNSLVYKYASIGSEFLKGALAYFKEMNDPSERRVFENEDGAVPASDRIVTLTHNQIAEFEDPTSEIIERVEETNGIADEPGLRELIIGKLKAGRELIRAGIFELKVLQLSLISALQILADRYREHVIGATAGLLLTMIAKQIGLPV